jgi:hypothetical protein
LLEMKQPTLTIIKNFHTNSILEDEDVMDDIDCSPRKFSEDQKLSWRLKTKILDDFAKTNMENWEAKALKILKIDTSTI